MTVWSYLIGGLGNKITWKAIGLVALIALAYFTVNRVGTYIEASAVARADNAVLLEAVDGQRQAIQEMNNVVGEWRDATREYQEAVQQMAVVSEQARGESRRIQVIFADHDFAKLAREKPGLIERRVNDGTARALRMFECATETPRGADCPDPG